MTHEVNGKQYVVISAGGHGSFGTKMGDYIVAYALRMTPNNGKTATKVAVFLCSVLLPVGDGSRSQRLKP